MCPGRYVGLENLLSFTQGSYRGKRMRSEINNSDLLISGLQKILRYLKVYPEIMGLNAERFDS